MSTNETSDRDRFELWVCTDCYFAHHYGAHEHAGAWYAGDSDTPCDREPLARVAELDLCDDTCAPDEDGGDDGHETFSWSRCDGCSSTLGGSRYRLAGWSRVPMARAFGIGAPSPIITEQTSDRERGCYCPGDCNCHRQGAPFHRPNYCGCRAHMV